MKKILLFSLWACLLFTNCKKNTAAKDQSVNLSGGILLFDEGNAMQNPSGITVSIENTNPLISTTTDNNGEYTLQVPDNLNSFTVNYSSQNMGTVKRSFIRNASGKFSRKDFNNILTESDWFGESFGFKSTVTVNSFSLSVINDSTLAVSCNISSPNITGEKYIRLLIQKDLPGISLNTIDQTDAGTYAFYMPVTNGTNTKNFCLKCAGICKHYIKNDKIYMTAFGESAYSNLYVDPASGKLVFPNLNPNNNNVVASFIMPI